MPDPVSPHFGRTLLVQGQAGAETRANEFLLTLDAFAQLTLLDRNRNAPPGSPGEGDAYHVGSSPSGAWSSNSGDIAVYLNGAWIFFTPEEGWHAWVTDENLFIVFTSPSAHVVFGTQAAAVASLTDNSGGSSGGDTIAAVSDVSTAADAIATLAAKVNALLSSMRTADLLAT